MRVINGLLQKDSSHKNYVITYSSSCHSKYVSIFLHHSVEHKNILKDCFGDH